MYRKLVSYIIFITGRFYGLIQKTIVDVLVISSGIQFYWNSLVIFMPLAFSSNFSQRTPFLPPMVLCSTFWMTEAACGLKELIYQIMWLGKRDSGLKVNFVSHVLVCVPSPTITHCLSAPQHTGCSRQWWGNEIHTGPAVLKMQLEEAKWSHSSNEGRALGQSGREFILFSKLCLVIRTFENIRKWTGISKKIYYFTEVSNGANNLLALKIRNSNQESTEFTRNTVFC